MKVLKFIKIFCIVHISVAFVIFLSIKIEFSQSIWNAFNLIKNNIVNPNLILFFVGFIRKKIYFHFPNLRENSKEMKRRNQELPESFNFREKENCFHFPIQNQRSCGSCWSFSTTNVMRYKIFKKYNLETQLSNEELVQCSKFSSKCNWGDQLTAMWYAKYYGITTDDCFTYTHENSNCPIDWIHNEEYLDHSKNFSCPLETAASANVTFQKYYTTKVRWIVPFEKELMKELIEHGPFATSFVVPDDFNSFDFASGDVFHSKGKWESMHVVTVIGYGNHEVTGEPYWLCENSWGSYWGLQVVNDTRGFFRMPRTNELLFNYLAFTSEVSIEKEHNQVFYNEAFWIGFLPLLIVFGCYLVFCFPFCCCICCCFDCCCRKCSQCKNKKEKTIVEDKEYCELEKEIEQKNLKNPIEKSSEIQVDQ